MGDQIGVLADRFIERTIDEVLALIPETHLNPLDRALEYDAGGDYQQLFDANRKKFEEKWNTRWEPQPVRASENYLETTKNIRDVAGRTLPQCARVLVVSKGDDELLKLNGCHASHFPQDDSGNFAGFYPGDSAEAIAQIETLRAKGAEFLIFPSTSRWWLDHYAEMRLHLEKSASAYECDSCVIFDIRNRPCAPVA